MGASSSVCMNKLYKHVDCGCIYCFDSYEVQLLYCCYDCLELLRNNKKPKQVKILNSEVKNSEEDILLNLEWKDKEDAIIYAKKNNILIEEFINNADLLKKFQFGA